MRTEVKHDPIVIIPAGTTLDAKLVSVEPVGPFKRKNPKPGEESEFYMAEWEFVITEETSEYLGLTVKTRTGIEPTDRTNDRFRNYCEAIAGCRLDVGAGIDTDDYLSLPCRIVVTVDKFDGRDGEVTVNRISDVLPANSLDAPPF